MLRTYGVTQLFGETDGQRGRLFENILAEALEPAGIGVIQVQLPKPGGMADVLYDPQAEHFTVQAASLVLHAEHWAPSAISLIVGAELIVVLVPDVTPGVRLELDAVAAAGRSDRTVVLVSGEDLGGPEDRTVVMTDKDEVPDTSETLWLPVLRNFPRVLWVGDLDPAAPLDSFMFRDLVDRLHAIAALAPDVRHRLTNEGGLNAAHPVSLTGVLEGYEALAPARRAQDRSDVAALYYGTAARLALSFGHVTRAVDHVIAQADLMSWFGRHRDAHLAVTELYDRADQWMRSRWDDDPAVVRLHARLVGARARMLRRGGKADVAKALLEDEAGRCRAPVNRRALSTLHTELAWNLREGTDPDAVLAAGHDAFMLARAEDACGDMCRALTVIGATLYDLRDLEQAESMLVHAMELGRAELDFDALWPAVLRLGEVLAAQGRDEDARVALERAVWAAEQGSFGWAASLARHRLAALG
jgi:tetratricopeptide (TPR) repeat protein